MSNTHQAGGPATYSKSHHRFPANAPDCAMTGRGPHLMDQHKRRYIDLPAGLGANIHGYGFFNEGSRVAAELSVGGCFSINSVVEEMAAEELANRFGVESVRFGKNGADATQSAVRLARYHTGREWVACSGYHGMHDWYIGSTKSNGGVLPQKTKTFDFFDINSLHTVLGEEELAAVVVEVPPTNPENFGTQAMKKHLNYLQGVTQAHGALFILDEIVTSCRYFDNMSHDHLPKLGFKGAFDLTPDLLCVGKGIANGFPISALCGSEELMSKFNSREVFFSTTFGGETFSLAAMIDTLEALNTGNLQNMHFLGWQLFDAYVKVMSDNGLPCEVVGDCARMVLHWHGPDADKLKTAWMAEHVPMGILYGVPIFPMTCWSDRLVSELSDAADIVASELRTALDDDDLDDLIPDGYIPGDVFKRYEDA